MGQLARAKPTYHALGRKGSHGAQVRRRAYPAPGAPVREGYEYGRKGGRAKMHTDKKGKK